jgi:hypothetical protein
MFKAISRYIARRRLERATRKSMHSLRDMVHADIAETLQAQMECAERRHIESMCASVAAGYLSQFGGDQMSQDTVAKLSVGTVLAMRKLVADAELGAHL